VKYVLTGLLCNPKRLDYQTVGPEAFRCLEVYLVHIGMQEQALVRPTPRSGVVVVNFQKLKPVCLCPSLSLASLCHCMLPRADVLMCAVLGVISVGHRFAVEFGVRRPPLRCAERCAPPSHPPLRQARRSPQQKRNLQTVSGQQHASAQAVLGQSNPTPSPSSCFCLLVSCLTLTRTTLPSVCRLWRVRMWRSVSRWQRHTSTCSRASSRDVRSRTKTKYTHAPHTSPLPPSSPLTHV
jgi:hypothetical protein